VRVQLRGLPARSGQLINDSLRASSEPDSLIMCTKSSRGDIRPVCRAFTREATRGAEMISKATAGIQ
jgi:hypothetical protein